MTRFILHLLAGAVLTACVLAPVAATAPNLAPQSADVATIAGQTAWETQVFTVRGAEEGPTVLVVAGVHGNEPAGWLAAEQIAGWTPTRGTLIVVPRANVPALAKGMRRVPRSAAGAGATREQRDLNRCFPMSEDEAPAGALPAALWELVRELEPDYLLDLHEGHDFTQVRPTSVGSSIISDATPGSLARAAAMIASLNDTIGDEHKRFVVKTTAVAGSLARAANEVLGVPSMILETTVKGQAVTFRARQHRILVATFLTALDMLDHGPDVLVGSAACPDDVRVAMYVSAGVGGSGPDRIEAILESEPGFIVRRVCGSDLRAGVLAQFDVVVFPGGSGSSQAKSIRASGRDAVRDFVDEGGGYVGICAGAYLAANNYDWSLDILDANVIDRENWARGTGDVELGLTGLGRSLLDGPGPTFDVYYANGPIYSRSRDAELSNYRVLAWFRGEVRKPGVPGGVMQDTPAIVMGRYGAGHVVCSSPHPELTDGCDALVRELVRLAARSR